MKWFKHESNARRDEKLRILCEKCGLEGYGIWWKLVEIVTENYGVGKEPITRLSFREVRAECRLSRANMTIILHLLDDLGLIEVYSLDDKIIEVSIPKLSKYCDVTNKRKCRNLTLSTESVLKRVNTNPPPFQHPVSPIEVDIDIQTSSDIKQTSSVSAEPSQSDSSPTYTTAEMLDQPGEDNPVVMEFPTKDKTKPFKLRRRRLEWYQDRFDGIDVEREFTKAQTWLDTNPTKRKAKVLSFLTNWLNRNKNSDSPRSNSETTEVDIGCGIILTDCPVSQLTDEERRLLSIEAMEQKKIDDERTRIVEEEFNKLREERKQNDGRMGEELANLLFAGLGLKIEK